MALRAVPDHPKFAEFKAILGVPKYAALGCLEAIWHFTGRFTPQGNIGKYSDTAIESWVEWQGEPGALIAALIQAGWLDRHPTHRLLVHDWAEHADKATKMSLGRRKLSFIEPDTDTVSEPTAKRVNGVCTEWGLPVPVPVPVPVPDPVYGATDVAQHTDTEPEQAEEIPKEPSWNAESGFALFYGEYWRKRNRDEAWDTYRKEITSPELHEALMRCLRRDDPMMRRRIAKDGNKDGVPYAAKYIHTKPWLDGDDTEEVQEAPRKVEKVATIFRDRTLEQFQQDQKPVIAPEITPEQIREWQNEAENSPIAFIRELAAKRLSEIQNPEVPKWKN
jgi:hypothetical protein